MKTRNTAISIFKISNVINFQYNQQLLLLVAKKFVCPNPFVFCFKKPMTFL